MPFDVLPATVSDLPTMMKVQFAAMSREPYHHAVFPGGNNPSTRAAAAERRLPDLTSRDESNLVMKVVERPASKSLSQEPETGGAILGWGKWKLIDKKESKEEWELPTAQQIQDSITWAEKSTWIWEAASEFLVRVTAMRQKHVRGQAHLLLNPCVTDPAHQRRGVSTALVRWGTQKADELELPAYLEATKAGRPVYERNGFRVIDEVVVDCDRWPEIGEKGKYAYVMMVREAKIGTGV